MVLESLSDLAAAIAHGYNTIEDKSKEHGTYEPHNGALALAAMLLTNPKSLLVSTAPQHWLVIKKAAETIADIAVKRIPDADSSIASIESVAAQLLVPDPDVDDEPSFTALIQDLRRQIATASTTATRDPSESPDSELEVDEPAEDENRFDTSGLTQALEQIPHVPDSTGDDSSDSDDSHLDPDWQLPEKKKFVQMITKSLKEQHVVPDSMTMIQRFIVATQQWGKRFPGIIAEIKPLDWTTGNQLIVERNYLNAFRSAYNQLMTQAFVSFIHYPEIQSVLGMLLAGKRFQLYRFKRPTEMIAALGLPKLGDKKTLSISAKEQVDEFVRGDFSEQFAEPADRNPFDERFLAGYSILNEKEDDFSGDWRDVWRTLDTEFNLQMDLTCLQRLSLQTIDTLSTSELEKEIKALRDRLQQMEKKLRDRQDTVNPT
ncbi:hypothetical protein C8J56DRAFT_1027988 [Mycena floridula]|nr:hypothetical protein C8J56DRAFT_1027988 [Mycena floridula]